MWGREFEGISAPILRHTFHLPDSHLDLRALQCTVGHPLGILPLVPADMTAGGLLDVTVLPDTGHLRYPHAMGVFRTILRRLFYCSAAVSMLLLVAILVLWPVSYYREPDATYFNVMTISYSIGADAGRLYLRYDGTMETPTPQPRQYYFRTYPWSEDDAFLNWSYLKWNYHDPREAGHDSGSLGVYWLHWPVFTVVVIPFSYVALLFAILPLLAFRSIRRRRRDAMSMRGFPVTTVEQTPKE